MHNLTIDDTPSVLSSTDLLPIHNDRLLRSNNRKGNYILNLRVPRTLLLVELIVVIRVHFEVVERKLLLDSFLERRTLLQCQGIRLRDNRNDVDDIGQFLENNDVDGLQGMAGRLDEE